MQKHVKIVLGVIISLFIVMVGVVFAYRSQLQSSVDISANTSEAANPFANRTQTARGGVMLGGNPRTVQSPIDTPSTANLFTTSTFSELGACLNGARKSKDACIEFATEHEEDTTEVIKCMAAFSVAIDHCMCKYEGLCPDSDNPQLE